MNSLPVAQLKELVNDALSPNGYFTESFHAARDHSERNVSVDDVIHGLKFDGWTLKSSEFDDTHGRWKYKIKTEDVEGDELVIVFNCWRKERGKPCIKIITRW